MLIKPVIGLTADDKAPISDTEQAIRNVRVRAETLFSSSACHFCWGFS